MAIRWPSRITPDPAPRTQFHHCNDLVPTIYEVLGITPPRVVSGVPQDPIDGTSFAYTFDDRDVILDDELPVENSQFDAKRTGVRHEA